ncbi:hypothetical protein JCM11641_000459 [Rhodosporidiobolus odoratus]
MDEGLPFGNELGICTLPGLRARACAPSPSVPSKAEELEARSTHAKPVESAPYDDPSDGDSEFSEVSELPVFDSEDEDYSLAHVRNPPATSLSPNFGVKDEETDEADVSSEDEPDESVDFGAEIKEDSDHESVIVVKRKEDEEEELQRSRAHSRAPSPSIKPDAAEEEDIKPKLPGTEEKELDDAREDFQLARARPRPKRLDANFNVFDATTWACIDRENVHTRRMQRAGTFHRYDVIGKTQGWWCGATEDQRRFKHKTARMTVFGNSHVGVDCREPGKAFAFRYYPLSYKTKRISTWIRWKHSRKDPAHPERKSEWWHPYGLYTFLGCIIPTADEFLRLQPELQEKLVEQFLRELRHPKSPQGIESFFDETFLADKEDQRKAIRTSLEAGKMNIAYNVFRYKRSILPEIVDSVEMRRLGRLAPTRKQARKAWAAE